MPDSEETKTTTTETTTVKTDSEKNGQEQLGGEVTTTKTEKSGDDQS
ncbi:hypothetical protein BH09BAC4_BH09BAC4_16030 [soil metagenome]